MAKLTKLLVVSIATITASAFFPHFCTHSREDASEGPFAAQSPSSNMPSPWSPTRSTNALDAGVLVNGQPRMAKDANFADAVVAAWNGDEADMIAKNALAATATETRRFEYQDAKYGATLYGHLIRRKEPGTAKVPGVLLFHTGAGPHDVFLQWKADSLASNKDIFPDGCVILVADVLSDDSGWGWSDDRTNYTQARNKVLKGEGSGERPLLQSRLRAALKALQEIAPEVDATLLCALGWCLGGHSVLELGRMKIPGMKAMITFHGVFDGVPPPSQSSEPSNDAVSEILICHGDLDPFVDQETVLKHAIDTLQQLGHKIRLLSLKEAKHGFTNPAQDFNPNPAFKYSASAADLAWSETLSLLKRTMATS